MVILVFRYSQQLMTNLFTLLETEQETNCFIIVLLVRLQCIGHSAVVQCSPQFQQITTTQQEYKIGLAAIIELSGQTVGVKYRIVVKFFVMKTRHSAPALDLEVVGAHQTLNPPN